MSIRNDEKPFANDELIAIMLATLCLFNMIFNIAIMFNIAGAMLVGFSKPSQYQFSCSQSSKIINA